MRQWLRGELGRYSFGRFHRTLQPDQTCARNQHEQGKGIVNEGDRYRRKYWLHTMLLEVRKEVSKEVVRQDAYVSFHVVVQDESRRDGRLILSPSPSPSPGPGTLSMVIWSAARSWTQNWARSGHLFHAGCGSRPTRQTVELKRRCAGADSLG